MKKLLVLLIISAIVISTFQLDQPRKTYPRRYRARAVWRRLPRTYNPRLGTKSFNYINQGRDWRGKCRYGRQQSPVALSTSDAICDRELTLSTTFARGLTTRVHHYPDTAKSFGKFNILRAENVDGNWFEYEAFAFHFHAPSEHTIDGKQYPLEVHFVHQIFAEFEKDSDRKLAVLGIMFEVDDSAGENPYLEQWDLYRRRDVRRRRTSKPFVLNLREVLSGQIDPKASFFTYKGSLTTPPCSEVVNWYVLRTPLKITSGQLRKFNALWKDNRRFANGSGNNRTLQKVGNRILKLGNYPCHRQKPAGFIQKDKK